MNLVLDFGNTKIKAAVFSDSNDILEIFTWDKYSEQIINEIKSKYLIDSVLLCSVVTVSNEVEQHLKSNFSFVYDSTNTSVLVTGLSRTDSPEFPDR